MTDLQQHIVDVLCAHDIDLQSRPRPIMLSPEDRWLIAKIVAPQIEDTLRSLRLENQELRLDLSDSRERYRLLAKEPDKKGRAATLKDLYGKVACREADIDRLEKELRELKAVKLAAYEMMGEDDEELLELVAALEMLAPFMDYEPWRSIVALPRSVAQKMMSVLEERRERENA